jgi:hypothetical protein
MKMRLFSSANDSEYLLLGKIAYNLQIFPVHSLFTLIYINLCYIFMYLFIYFMYLGLPIYFGSEENCLRVRVAVYI